MQDTRAGETVASLSETGTEADVLELVARAGAALRDGLGIEPLSAAHASSVRASMPASPQATRLYVQGLSKLRLFDAPAARDLLQRAIAIDPKHALSHSALAATWSALGYDARAQQEAKTAFDLSTALSREERLDAEGRYREMTREWNNAIDIYRTLFDFYPDTLEYGLRLAEAQTAAGQGHQALATTQRLRANPAWREDPRIDFVAAGAATSVGDFRGSHAAAERATRASLRSGARLQAAAAIQRDGIALRNLGALNEALAAFSKAQELFASAGDRRGVANTLLNTATILYDQGKLDDVTARFQQALDFYRRIKDKLGQSRALNNLGGIEVARNRLAEGQALFEQSLVIAREIDNKRTVAATLNNLGVIHVRRRRMAEARGRFEEALATFRGIGDRGGEAEVVHNLGDVLVFEGELASAQTRYEESLQIRQGLRAQRVIAGGLQSLGAVLLARGDLRNARTHCDEALKIMRDIGAAPEAEACVAEVLLEEGKAGEAADAARRAVEQARKSGGANEPATRLVLVRSLLEQGDVVAAQDELRRAGAALNEGTTSFLTAVLNARIEAAMGRHTEAIRDLTQRLNAPAASRLVGDDFLARLALGQIELSAGLPAGVSRLESLERQARARGFGLIAAKTAAALAGSIPARP